MVKRGFIVFAAALAILLNTAGNVCQAAILPRHGAGQSGFSAVVLCEALTVRQEADAGSKAVGTLSYGKQFAMMEKADGWAKCVLSDDVDASPAGWVNANYILVDPAWYRTDGSTPVYAWNDTTAPKVALLDGDTTLPIVKDKGDWVIVSLRGGVGWIHKTAADKEAGEQTDEPSDSPAEKPSENPTDTTDKIDKSDKSLII